MINFITHPAITNLLEQSKVKMKYPHDLVNTVIVSDFLPHHKNNIHGGLQEAVTYRIKHPTHYILLLSFETRDELLSHDAFGILSLQGTTFIQLPMKLDELYASIDQFIKNGLTIPNKDWKPFAINACKIFLKEKLRILRHIDKLGFGNNVTNPIRIAAVCVSEYPGLVSVVKKHLGNVKEFTKREEIVQIFFWANSAVNLQDSFLQSVCQFTEGLHQLEMYAAQEEIDIKQLILDIDKLNEIDKQIHQQ